MTDPRRIDEIKTHPIHIWETPCSCHCSKEQAAFCPVIRACRYPEHPNHERAKAIMAQAMSFPHASQRA